MCGGLNIATVALYKRRQRLQKSLQMSSNQLIEKEIDRRLTVYAFITFAAQLIMAIYMVSYN